MTLNQFKHSFAQISRLRQSVFNNSFLLVFALLLPVVFAASCAESSSEKAARVGGVTAQQIIENPSAYVGKTVTVSGDVEEIHSPRSFNMDSGASVGELLVVGREPFPNLAGADNRAYVINDVATVTGVVRMLVKEDIEREIGWNLDPQIVATFTSKPVLVAQSANFKPNTNRGSQTVPANVNSNQTTMMNGNQTTMMNGNQMTANTNNMSPMANTSGSQMTGNSGTANSSGAMLTDIGVYGSTADKLSFVGKNAKFTDARVVRVVGPRTFTVASGKDEVYVMLDDESARGVGTQGKINAGDTVSVAGDFERLDAGEISDISNNRFRPLTEQERAFLKKTQVFLQAHQVTGGK